MKYIYRNIFGENKYWTVRIRRNLIDVTRKSFSDKEYGGSSRAKKAAIEYRDSFLKTLPPLFIGLSSRSKSGYYGVYIVKGGYRGAISTSNGYLKSKLFTFKKHGTEALALAVAFREEGIKNRDTIKKPVKKNTIHGTYAKYHSGCRCWRCTKANAEYNAVNRCLREKRLRDGLAPKNLKHGDASTFTNWGCRCKSCVDAHAKKLRLRRKKQSCLQSQTF